MVVWERGEIGEFSVVSGEFSVVSFFSDDISRLHQPAAPHTAPQHHTTFSLICKKGCMPNTNNHNSSSTPFFSVVTISTTSRLIT
jgi:hypothetical protein